MASIASWQLRPGLNPYDRGSNRASHSGSSALRTRAWWHLSLITGMPSGRILVLSLALGIYTRRTATGCHEFRVACTCTATSARARLVSATCPSTPAVLRPVLRCVTWRTLISVLDQDRSTNFCRFLTVARSPSFAALKILHRSRRTRSSCTRQSTCSQASPSKTESGSSGPFTEVSNLPLSSGICVCFDSKAHLSTSAPLSGPGTTPGIRPVIRRPSGRSSQYCGLRFPAAFQLPAFASWTPCPARRDSAPIAVGLPQAPRIPAHVLRTLAGFTRSARMRPGPGWALSLPRGQRCSLAIASSVAAACRLPSAGPYSSGTTTQPRMWTCRGICESFLVVAPCRPFPSPVAAMAGTAALGLSRELQTRPIRNRPRMTRWGQVEHRPVATSSTYAEPPQRAHSLRATSCRNKGGPYRDFTAFVVNEDDLLAGQGLQLGDELLGVGFGVDAAGVVVGAEVGVGLPGGEHVPDDLDEGVGDGERGFLGGAGGLPA